MSDYGTITEAGSIRFERLLSAPINRVWDYLTDPELRRSWFAGGAIEAKPDGKFTLVFRNSELAPGEADYDDDESPSAADPDLAAAEAAGEIESGGERAGMGRGEKPRKAKSAER